MFSIAYPGLERSNNPGIIIKIRNNPERVRQPPNPFRVHPCFLSPIQGSRGARTLGSSSKSVTTLKGFANRRTLSGFIGPFASSPGLSLRSNPGLKLANAFGVRRTAYGVRRSAFGVRPSAFGVRPSAFAVWRLAFGVRRLPLGRLGVRRYSYLSATNGSILVARRAGT